MVDMIELCAAVASTVVITSNEWRGLALGFVVTHGEVMVGENALTAVSWESIMHAFRQNAIIILGAIMMKGCAME